MRTRLAPISVTLAAFCALATLPCAPAAATTGPTLKTLYSFPGGGDGTAPRGGLVNVSGVFYGTTASGGANGRGAVYSINATTGVEALVYSFATGPDVAAPQAGLIAVGSLLYGVASTGGANGLGGVYSINPATGAEAIVFSFTAATGGASSSSLISSGGNLYGTTYGGGSAPYGVIFQIDIKTAAVTTVYSFTGGADGGNPRAGVILYTGNFYGTTTTGGAFNAGTVFAIDQATGVETTLINFDGESLGRAANGGVIQAGGLLYGATAQGGATGNGLVYSYNLTANTVSIVYNFTGATDGGSPQAPLLNISGVLYGTASAGGANGYGTVFSLTPSTGAEQTLYAFTGGTNGGHPVAPLINVNGVLYGTDLGAETASVNNGTAFSLPTAGGTATTLHNFSGPSPFGPGNATLLNVKGTFYGTSGVGGNSSAGSVFTIVPTTAAQTTVYNFTGGADGGAPDGGLINDTSTLYGVATSGGAHKTGAIFSINPTTNAQTVLYSFPAGAQAPNGPLVLVKGVLYGTTQIGGNDHAGSVFGFNPSKKTLTTVYSFKGGPDGGFPLSGLTQNGGYLYGTTQLGGTGQAGTLFSLDIATGAQAVLYPFTNTGDGGFPAAPPVYVGGVLYGTAPYGGTQTPACYASAGCGVLYSFNISTSAYTVLHSFTASVDGALPQNTLSVVGTVLYGGTSTGGPAGGGTVFSYTPASSTFSTVYNFTGGADGAAPGGGLITLKNVLYGTTNAGGTVNAGTIFGLTP
jgi:uncharacterized repeat protein (TIGR03803 family)